MYEQGNLGEFDLKDMYHTNVKYYHQCCLYSYHLQIRLGITHKAIRKIQF